MLINDRKVYPDRFLIFSDFQRVQLMMKGKVLIDGKEVFLNYPADKSDPGFSIRMISRRLMVSL